ncbi:MAG: T9SS type A sorting domain-containing protein, partial [Ignavibacteria bacterium]|nr:T9SS type A sorting domain-containing protein [Ignavibacteria bacterium]
YSLQNPELVTLKVFDVLGREVSTLINQYQTAGSHTVNFNAANLPSGIYFYKIKAGSFQNIKKLMLLK